MGYSCLALAGMVADEAVKIAQAKYGDAGGTSNSLGTDRENPIGFYERGREQSDGAVTGTYWKTIQTGQWKGRVNRAGGYRIDNEGIKRFPMLTKAERDKAWAEGNRKFEATYGRGLVTYA